MTKIKKIETKTEWLKFIIDGAKGVSNRTYEGEYILWDENNFVYSTGGKVNCNLHDEDFGIIEEVEEVELFEYMYKSKDEIGTWYTYPGLYTEEEAKVEFKNYKYRKTGRSFKVQKD